MENVPKDGARTVSFEPTVHGLRGFAALGIFLFHVYDMMRKQNIFDPMAVPYVLKAAIISLSCGVDLFFMISGYLITGSLIRHDNIRKFFIDRVARIYPVFLVLHVALFLVAPVFHYKWTVGLTPAQWVFHFTTNLLMLPGVFKLPLMQLNAWTLSYEWLFYIVSAAAYAAYAKKLNWLKSALVLAVPVLLLVYPRAVFFIAGAAVFAANRRDFALPKWVTNPAVVIALPFLFAGMMGYSNDNEAPWMTYLAFVPGILLFALVTRASPIYAAVLRSRPIQFMGTISYSFYLLHPVVTTPLKILAAKILRDKFDLPPILIVAIFGTVAFVITVAVSYVSYRVLEKWGTRWVKAVLRGERLSPVLPIRARLAKLIGSK